MISIDDFKKVEIRIGKVLKAENIEGAKKLLRLTLDTGDKTAEGEMLSRVVLSGIALVFPDPAVLVGKMLPIIVNLEPRPLMGEVSNGMLMAIDGPNGPVLFAPESEVLPGAAIK